MTHAVSIDAYYARLGLHDTSMTIDVRTPAEWQHVPRMIPGAYRLDPSQSSQWSRHLTPQRSLVLYASGSSVGPIADDLSARGFSVSILEGGLAEWQRRRLPTIRVRDELGVPGRSQWVTRERPKIDRLACPWLIKRFIDPSASFFYVPAPSVRAQAQALGAQPYDIADVTFSHRDSHCSFDAFLDEFDLRDPSLDELAKIVRSADTGMLDHAKEAAGLLAISLGLSASISNDQLLLDRALPIYDALYTWCKSARNETHSWPQQALQ